MKVLIVCKGNICRSPIAEGLIRDKLIKEGMENITVDSAGTGHWHIGNPPDPRAIETARRFGTDISMLRARQFQLIDFEEFDFIFVMDHQNMEKVYEMTENVDYLSKVNMMSIFLEEDKEVDDPYHHGERQFDQIYKMLDNITDNMISTWKGVSHKNKLEVIT